MIDLEATSKKALVKQSLLTVSVSLAYFSIGLVRGWSAPSIPSIRETVPGLLPNKNIASWASSVPPLGAFFGSLTAAPLMHKIGRKYTVLLTSPIWAISWTVIALSQRFEVVIAGRFLSGFAAGLTIPSAQIFVSECCSAQIRGVLGSLPSMSMSIGILVTFIMGKFWAWDTLAWVCCTITACMFGALVFLPESPVWLKTKHQHEKAASSAKWLHLSGFDMVETRQMDKMPNASPTIADDAKLFSRKIFFSRAILQPFGIGVALLTFQQFSGIDAIIFFTVEIFRNAGSSLNSHDATIIVGFVQVLSNFCSLFFVDRYGRKPLLIISGIIMAGSTGVMGAAFYLNSIGNTCFGFLPLVSLIVFMTGFSVGFGVIPFLLMGELFPTNSRSILSSLAGSLNLAIMFIVIKTYHPLEELITTAGTFWMYSVLCVLGVMFVIFFVPETKGKELESIAQLFVKQRPARDTNGKAHQGHDNITFATNDEHTTTNHVGEKTKL